MIGWDFVPFSVLPFWLFNVLIAEAKPASVSLLSLLCGMSSLLLPTPSSPQARPAPPSAWSIKDRGIGEHLGEGVHPTMQIKKDSKLLTSLKSVTNYSHSGSTW